MAKSSVFAMTEIEEFRSLGISTAGLGSDLPVPAQNALVTIVAAVAPLHKLLPQTSFH